MKLAGKRSEPVNLEEFVSSVTDLPSGFANRTEKRTNTRIYDDHKTSTLNEKGDGVFEGVTQPTSAQFSLAYTYHKQALEAAERHKNPLVRAIALSRYASVLPFIQSEGVNSSIRALTDATVTARDIGAKDLASQFAGSLHAHTYRMVKHCLEQPTDPKDLEGWDNALRNVRIQAATLFRNERGQPGDVHAMRIEQGEVGFSNDDRIGTDGVAQCITPVMHNPETKQTALAHVDQSTDIQSLQHVLDKIGYSNDGMPIQVRLVGGNDKVSSSSNLHWFYQAMAQGNVSATLEFFKDKNIDILSADILEEDQPRTLVVDPKTFTLTEAIPSQPNPDMFLATGFAMLSVDEERPLRTAFDLSRSTERSPILIGTTLATKLTHLTSQNLLGIYGLFYQDGTEMKRGVAEHVEATLDILDAHVTVVNEMMQAISEHGLHFTEEGMNAVWSAATQRPIYVGSNAEPLNQPVFEFIRNGFAKQGSLFRRPSINIPELLTMPVPPSPMDLIHS